MSSKKNRDSGIDRIIYTVMKLYSIFLKHIPFRLCLFIGRCFGLIFYIVDFHHRKIGLINLRFAFEREKDEKEIRSIARKHFQNLGMTGHEWLCLKDLGENDLKKICDRIYIEGKEHLISAKKQNKAVIILSAHFGNWEYSHLCYASHINRLNFIVRKLDNFFLEQERIDYNQNFNVNILYKENGLREAIRNLRNGEDLVIFSDRKANMREGIPSQFFGKKTSTIPLASALSKKYNIPIVPMFIVRCQDKVHHKIVFQPMFNVGDLDEERAVQTGTQIQNDNIEKVIRRYPDQWLWIHRKWKCYHSHIYK
jgi:KDO2-lipid IV(A) lauroyltransferase